MHVLSAAAENDSVSVVSYIDGLPSSPVSPYAVESLPGLRDGVLGFRAIEKGGETESVPLERTAHARERGCQLCICLVIHAAAMAATQERSGSA